MDYEYMKKDEEEQGEGEEEETQDKAVAGKREQIEHKA